LRKINDPFFQFLFNKKLEKSKSKNKWRKSEIEKLSSIMKSLGPIPPNNNNSSSRSHLDDLDDMGDEESHVGENEMIMMEEDNGDLMNGESPRRTRKRKKKKRMSPLRHEYFHKLIERFYIFFPPSSSSSNSYSKSPSEIIQKVNWLMKQRSFKSDMELDHWKEGLV